MTNEGRTRRASRRGVRTALRRVCVTKLLVFAAAWALAGGGFVVYLLSLDSFMDAYGGVGTAVVLVLWVTLFSVLYYATPSVLKPLPEPPRQTSVPAAGVGGSPLVDRVDLVVTPSAALRNPAAQGRMMSVLGPRASDLSDREVDMMDWGFAFGVAWAVARRQDPAAPEELISLRALDATHAVYQAYRGDPAPAPATNGHRNGSAPDAHPDAVGAAHARDPGS